MKKPGCTNNYCLDGWIWKQMGEFPDGPCPDCTGAAEDTDTSVSPRSPGLWTRISALFKR